MRDSVLAVQRESGITVNRRCRQIVAAQSGALREINAALE